MSIVISDNPKPPKHRSMASLVSNETTPTLIEDPDVPQNAIATIAKTTTTTTATSKTTVNVEGKKKDGKLNEESNTTELNQKTALSAKSAQFRKSSISRINQMRRNLKGSKRRAWDKYGSLVGFKKKTEDLKICVDKLKEKWGIVEDDLEDINPFVHTPVTPDPDVPSVAMVDGKLVRLEKDGKLNEEIETKPRFNNSVTRADILYYLEHYEEFPFSGNKNKRKKAMKKIKKKKQEECGIRLKKCQVSSFVIRLRTIVNELKRKELSGDELNNEIDIMLKPRTPSPPSSPESLGSLAGLDDDELELEDIRRDREAIAENYYKAHPEEVRVTLRPVSPVRKGEGDY